MNRLLIGTLSCLMFFLPLSAQEEEFIPVGDRTDEVVQEMGSSPDGDLVLVEEESDQLIIETAESFKRTPIMSSTHVLLPFDYGAYPGYDHWAVLFSGDCRVVELEDKSQWKVAEHDVYKTLRWVSGDMIAIYPDCAWFPSGEYCIVNRRTGDSAEAILIRSAVHNGPYTKYIYGVDHYHNFVMLTDGSRWVVNPRDHARFGKWLVSDMIIIGMNDRYWSSRSYPAMLINVNRNEWVFAKIQ